MLGYHVAIRISGQGVHEGNRDGASSLDSQGVGVEPFREHMSSSGMSRKRVIPNTGEGVRNFQRLLISIWSKDIARVESFHGASSVWNDARVQRANLAQIHDRQVCGQ